MNEDEKMIRERKRQLELRKDLEDLVEKYMNTMDSNNIVNEFYGAAAKIGGFVASFAYRMAREKAEKERAE